MQTFENDKGGGNGSSQGCNTSTNQGGTSGTGNTQSPMKQVVTPQIPTTQLREGSERLLNFERRNDGKHK